MLLRSGSAPRVKRHATKGETFSLLILMVAVFGTGTYLGTNYVPLVALIAVYSCFISWRCGYSLTEIEAAAGKKIGKAIPIFTTFVTVGMLVGALIYCGTVPMLIYYGTILFDPQYLYLCAFLLCAVFSLLTGTSHGSIGTAGLVMISLGQAMPGINLPMLAGAIVCGAIVGDKISPFSDTTLMAATVTENNVYDHVAHQAKTVIPSAVLTIVIYLIIGFTTPRPETVVSPEMTAMRDALAHIYSWNILLTLPAFVIVYGAVRRKSTTATIFSAAIVGIIVGMVVQGFSLSDGIKSLYDGFNVTMVRKVDLDTLDASIKTICNRGGIISFSKTFYTAFICYYFAAATELSGTLYVILEVMNKFIKNAFTLVLSTGISMILMNCLCGSSTPAASVVGPLLKPEYEKMGLHSLNLAREIEDFGTGSTAFIPWSASGALYAGVLGVSNFAYFKYAFFIWIIWILALVYSATGIYIKKLNIDHT